MNAPKAQINRARLLPGLVKRLLFVAILTVGANYFFWRHRIGINLPLYAGVLGLGMIVNGRGLQNNRSFWVFAFLLVGSILAGADAPSLPNFFCLATLLVLLAGICFYRTRNPWRRFFRAVLSFWGRLGPGGWGSLQRLAESGSPLSMPAQLVLTRIHSRVWQESSKKKRWQSFQFRRYLCEAQLLRWLPREAR